MHFNYNKIGGLLEVASRRGVPSTQSNTQSILSFFFILIDVLVGVAATFLLMCLLGMAATHFLRTL